MKLNFIEKSLNIEQQKQKENWKRETYKSIGKQEWKKIKKTHNENEHKTKLRKINFLYKMKKAKTEKLSFITVCCCNSVIW